MNQDGEHPITPFVSNRLPEFVRVDHPTLVSFLEAYYEWLGLRRDSGIVLTPMSMHDIPDVDTSLEQFLSHFKNQYLFNFPETLALSQTTNEPVDPRRLMKNIKQFYRAKGTEKSYEFLFRVLYDTAVEFYYPKTDILRLSSGRWIQNNYLRVSNSLGDQIYRSAGNLIVQKNANGQVIATARVVNVNVYQIGNFDVAELLITGRNGTFQSGELGIDFEDEGQAFHEVRVFSVVSTLSIQAAGSNYQLGERVRFVSNTNDGGQKAVGTIVELDAVGGIRKINIDDFGINYSNQPEIIIDTSRGTGFVGSVEVGALCQASGYYSNNDGRISTNKVLQDNHYYQNWSYVLKSEVVIDTYREVIRRLVHPVGTAMFGSVLIKRCSKANLNNASALMSFRIPYIGNYAPYTFRTFDDLSLWFQESITGGMTASGYLPSEHDGLITSAGDRIAVIGNPISNNVGFKDVDSGWLSTPGFPNADPFWIVYPHANKQVESGYHYARIWKTQATDFVRWPEWINNIQYRSERQAQFDEMVRSTYDGNQIGAGLNVQYLVEGGIAGDPNEGAGGGGPNGGNAGDCFLVEEDGEIVFRPPPGCVAPSELELPNGIPCCCCIRDSSPPGGPPGVSVPLCKCEDGIWSEGSDGWACRCPYGYLRERSGCGYRCRCPNGDGNCGESPLCPTECPVGCCIRYIEGTDPPRFETFCRHPIFGCNERCLDLEYAFENCCECYGIGGGPPGQESCCDDTCPNAICCLEDPCTDECSSFCLENPSHPWCIGFMPFYCANCPCASICPNRFCNPSCPQFDPCLTTCPGFDYCITASEYWSQAAIERRAENCPQYGPCYGDAGVSCFDKCTAEECEGYQPCHQDCPASREPCGVTCPNECLCDNTCNQDCEGFDWCICDPGGLTCCIDNPCLPVCNPDPCGITCPVPCTPTCPDFDPCDPSCPGYGPCHPDCPPVPGDPTRRPCNPICPGYDRCNRDCPNYDVQLCCQGCNCGGGGGIGDVIYRRFNEQIERWNEERFRPEDNNLCNNDISLCLRGRHYYNDSQFLGTLLKYNEYSEFRKITMESFFKMPVGESFDCREESIAAVALPQFINTKPTSGQEVKTTDPNRPLTVRFETSNQENLKYYSINQVNIYIDNVLRSTVSVNNVELTLTNVTDGRKTLKLEMIDKDGNLVAGTQKIVIFGYQYVRQNRN